MFIVTSSGFKFSSLKIIHLVLDEITDYNWKLSQKMKGKKKNILVPYNKKIKVNLSRFKYYDTLVVHGGDTIRIWESLQKNNLLDIVRDFCENKMYIGVSAGGLILTEKSLILKDDIDQYTSVLNKKFLGISKLYYDVHYDSMRNNPVYLKSLKRVSSKMKNTIYLLEDESYVINDITFIGNIYSTKGVQISHA